MLLLPIGLLASAPAVITGLLLDTLATTTMGAYSFRKLRSAYAGACLRVRRSSDNTELDIGFALSAVDTATILSFCGSGSGFITAWYDQSGNGQNMAQAAAANQPRLCLSGTLDRLGNGTARPCLTMLTPNNWMQNAFSFGGAAAAYAVAAVASRSASCPDGGRLLGFAGAAATDDYSSTDSNIFMRYATGGLIVVGQGGSTAQLTGSTSPFQAVMTCSAGVQQLTMDGAVSPSSAVGGALASPGTLLMGIYNTTSNANAAMWDGAAAEFLVTAGTLTGTDQATIKASQRSYYGTP